MGKHDVVFCLASLLSPHLVDGLRLQVLVGGLCQREHVGRELTQLGAVVPEDARLNLEKKVIVS